MSRRTRWTQEELHQLRQIYEQESLMGPRRLWVRITARINQDVRKAKRQAIEYKWKNFCRTPSNGLKLRENQLLIEQLFALIPFQGYKQLSANEHFQGITESSLKNMFYSQVRSISHFLHRYVEQSQQEITVMLKDRSFLCLLHEQGVDFLQFRGKISRLRKMAAERRKQRGESEEWELLKGEVVAIYSKIRALFATAEDKVKSSKTTIYPSSELKEESSNTMFSNCKIEEPLNYPSMQLLESLGFEVKLAEEEQRHGSFRSVDYSCVYPIRFGEGMGSSEWLYADF